jgi:hypothetical protein
MSTNFQTPESCLSNRLLRYIRDMAPTEAEFLAWLGGPREAVIYHALRKAGLLILNDNRLQLSPRYVSVDGKQFSFANSVYCLDTEEVWRIRRNQNLPTGADQ